MNNISVSDITKKKVDKPQTVQTRRVEAPKETKPCKVQQGK